MSNTYKIQTPLGNWSPPVDEAGLVAFIQQGAVTPQTVVFDDQTGQAGLAGQIPALADMFALYSRRAPILSPPLAQTDNLPPGYVLPPGYGPPGQPSPGVEDARPAPRINPAILVSIVLIAASIFGIAFLLRPGASGPGYPEKVVTSADGRCQITVPASWLDVRHTSKDGEQRDIMRQHPSGMPGVMVQHEHNALIASADLKALAGLFAEVTARAMNGTVDEASATVNVNGRQTVQHSIRTQYRGYDLVFLHSVFAVGESVYQIMCFTTPKNLEKDRSMLSRVVESFKETGSG